MRQRKTTRKANRAPAQNEVCQAIDMPKRATRTFAQAIGRIIDYRFGGNKSELARAVGVAPSTVTRWLDGQSPSADTIQQLCVALQMQATELLGGDTPIPPSVSRDQIAAKEQAAAVDYLIRQGNDAEHVSMAAAIVARRLSGDEPRPPLWWVAQILDLLHELT